jgi:hypothetical protein
MARPYKVPNKSSAIDIFLSGVRGALSAGLTLEQQSAQKQQAAREWQLKLEDLNIKRDQLSQQWDIARFNAEQDYKNMISKQDFDLTIQKMSNQAAEDLSTFDFRKQMVMSMIDDEEQTIRDTAKRSSDIEENAKDREIKKMEAEARTKELQSDTFYKSANLNLAIGNANETKLGNRMDWLYKAAGLENKPGATLEEKQKDLDSSFNSALGNYNHATKESAVEMYDALSAISIQRALNKFSIGGKGGWDTVVYTYDYSTGEPYTTDFAGYYTQQSSNVQEQILESRNRVAQAKPLTQKFQEAATGIVTTPVESETGGITKKAGKPLSQKTVAPIIPTKTTVQQPVNLPEDMGVFQSNISNMASKDALNYLKSNRDSIISNYSKGYKNADQVVDGMISDLSKSSGAVLPTKVGVAKVSSLTDIYNKLSKIVNIDSVNPNPVWKRMDLNKLDDMVKSTDREQLLTALTNILSRAGNKNPRVTAENIIKNYTRMVGK